MLKNKIAVIICYFGEKPKWFDYFLRTCSLNKDIHWYFFTDQFIESNENIIFREFSIDDFNKLVRNKIGINVELKVPYKVCDFRPVYGVLFEDYLEGYDFWGYSDIDLLYGEINKFITSDHLRDFDIISTYKNFLSGPFCLFRNTPVINKLYKLIFDYNNNLAKSNYLGLDETVKIQTKPMRFSLKYIYLVAMFLLSNFKLIKNGVTSKEIRYQFQWYYKRMNINDKVLNDLTDVVYCLLKKKEINVYFGELLYSDKYFERMNYKNWKIVWENGVLLEENKKKEIFGFHFINMKKESKFTIKPLKNWRKVIIKPYVIKGE